MLDKKQAKTQEVTLRFERPTAQACWLLADLVSPQGQSLLLQMEQWHRDYGGQ